MFKSLDVKLIPKPCNPGSFDIFSPLHIEVKPGAIVSIDSQIQVCIPTGYIGILSPKFKYGSVSGMIMPSQIIHSSFENNIFLNFIHFDYESIYFNRYEAIAQLSIVKHF